MSLLPRSHKQFQLKEYWDTFFTKRNVPFEWYGEYLDHCHVLHKYLKPQNKVLVIGCGNSKLSEDLYDAGIHAIDNIDISEVVIKQMTARNKDKRPDMTYHVMDMLNVGYKDGLFDCVLDKGTLDAVFTDDTEKTLEKVDKLFSEVERILKIGGRYVCASLAQEHILDKLMLSFGSGWVVRVHKVNQEAGGSSVGSRLPVFVFIMTKMVNIQGRPPLKVFEYVSDSGKCIRCSGVDGVKSFVKDSQQFALVRHNLSSIQIGEQFHVDLWDEDVENEPRFTLTVVDIARRKAKNGQFAIFIAPWGRETDWIFSSEPGRRELAESAGFDRLVLVTLHRGHTYHGLDQVKEEVSSKALELAQDNLPEGRKWPVLTLGEGLGNLRVLYEDSSPFNGKFVVEESELPGQDGCVRRLVFTNSPHLAQTEVVMEPIKSKKTTRKSRFHSSGAAVSKIIDHTHLMFGHHTAMIASLALVDGFTQSKQGHIHTLTVGLGGGALSAFIGKFLPQYSQVVIEQDHKMVDVASKWFGLPSQIKVHVDDGVEYVKKLASDVSSQGAFNAVILDVDSKDHSNGLSSPPFSFLSEEFLTNAKNLLSCHGILITNMCARNKELRSKALSSLLCVFKVLLVLSVPKDINEVVIGMLEWREDLLGEDCSNRTACDEPPSSSRMFSQEIKQLFPLVERVTLLSSCLSNVPSERLKTVKQELLDCFDHVVLVC